MILILPWIFTTDRTLFVWFSSSSQAVLQTVGRLIFELSGKLEQSYREDLGDNCSFFRFRALKVRQSILKSHFRPN